MKRGALGGMVRRRIELPRGVVEAAMAVAPAEPRIDFDRFVTVALEEFTRCRRAQIFEEAMAKMAADPAIRAECVAIAGESESA